MVDESRERLRLSLMQDVLPVGMAILERARQGGINSVIDVFTTSKEPLQELRVEGDSAAQSFRQTLDDLSPGLGNPVVPVDIAVHDQKAPTFELEDEESLMICLNRIEMRLNDLERYLNQEVSATRSNKG